MATKNSFEHQCNNVFNRSRTVTCHQHIINNKNRRKTALICFPLTFVHIQLKFVAHSLLINSPAAAGAAAKKTSNAMKQHHDVYSSIDLKNCVVRFRSSICVLASRHALCFVDSVFLFRFFKLFFFLDSFSRYFDSSFIIAFFHSQQISA